MTMSAHRAQRAVTCDGDCAYFLPSPGRPNPPTARGKSRQTLSRKLHDGGAECRCGGDSILRRLGCRSTALSS